MYAYEVLAKGLDGAWQRQWQGAYLEEEHVKVSYLIRDAVLDLLTESHRSAEKIDGELALLLAFQWILVRPMP